MWLRKNVTPGAAPGGYTWDSPEHVVEVPEELGLDLLGVGGFEVVEAPTGSDQRDGPDGEDSDSAVGADGEPAAEVVEAPVAPKKRSPRKPSSSVVSE